MQPIPGLIYIEFVNWPGFMDAAAADSYLFEDICSQGVAQGMLPLVQALVPGATLSNTNSQQPFRMLVAQPGYGMWVINGTTPNGLTISPYAAYLADTKPTAPAQLALQEFPSEGYANVVWQLIPTPATT